MNITEHKIAGHTYVLIDDEKMGRTKLSQRSLRSIRALWHENIRLMRLKAELEVINAKGE